MDFGLINPDDISRRTNDTSRRTNSPSRDQHNQRGRRRGNSPLRHSNSIYGSNSNSNDNDNNSSSVFSTMYNPMFELMRMGSRDDQDGRKMSNDEEWATDLRKRYR